jgi:nucleoside-diphosphate-sugar epimerase
MANILITGGAGFIGRWVSKNLVNKRHKVWILDNLSNGTESNIEEFRNQLGEFVMGDIKDKELLSKLFEKDFEVCIHLAATINVQESIDNPEKCFNDNLLGTFNVLNECRKYNTKMVFVSSALIYETAKEGQKITEDHHLSPSCPYTASKISGEKLVISYYKTYNLPIVILRPFSVYGPWQKSNSEGGVISIFIDRKLKGKPIEVFGNGKQGRDFFYIEDCAEFIVEAAFTERAIGQIFNAGSGQKIKIKDLAKIIAGESSDIKFVKHPHPHAEVMNMCADSSKAEKILGWRVRISLEEGLNKTREWLKSQQN